MSTPKDDRGDWTPHGQQTIEELQEQLEQQLQQQQQQWLRVTLSSIGDAVVTTDNKGDITFLNPVAETLTGWTQEDAVGKPLETVFKIVNETSRRTVENPAVKALREGVVVGLANHTLLIAKDGTEWPIDDSAAPIRNAAGEVAGVVLIFRDVTERKRQEQQVQDARTYADNILATLREPFLVLNQSLRVVTANHSFYEKFHVTPEETQGRFLYELGNQQWDIPKLRTLLEEVLPQDHTIENFAVESDFPTVGRKVMLLNARRILRPGNHSELILLAIEDVTEHRQAEEALIASEERFRTLFESGPVAVYACDAAGVIQEFNSRAAELWGRKPALGDTTERFCGSFKLFRPDGSFMPHEQCPMAEVVSGQISEMRDAEVLIERPDGSRVTVVVNIRPLKNQRGEVTGAINCFHDISERKQAEQKLHVSEVRYRRLFEAAKDGILILDTDTGRIVDANPFMSELLGYSHADFSGKEMWEIGLFSDKAANEAAVRELQSKGYVRYEHLPLESDRGRRVEVEVVANVYQEEQHSVIQCNIRDITERTRLESLLRDQAAEVSDLHRRKDEFLAMLSHELRSPLAPIANAVQLLGLQRESESRTQQQARGIIERQLGQLQHLVDDLLEVSRITSGRIQLRQERVAICRIVEGAVETVRPLFEHRRHEFTVLLPAEPIWLNADVARLEQVLVNLLTNAAKFTDEGGHVWLTVQQESDECVVRVRDNGVGIAPALLPRIFDLFTQGERSLERAQGGLGIGLALVHRLTELHGGKVEVLSTLGQGSEFIVRLPVAPGDTQPTTLPVTETGHPSTRPLRVLVVDDNVDTVLSFSMLLRASGHDVRTTHDGPTAVQAAHDYRPDVVLLDIGLPGLNGYEVAKRIRQDPALKNVVLVAVTGYGQEADRQTSLESGFNHHLVKPPSFKNVQQILAIAAEKAN